MPNCRWLPSRNIAKNFPPGAMPILLPSVNLLRFLPHSAGKESGISLAAHQQNICRAPFISVLHSLKDPTTKWAEITFNSLLRCKS
jgi:hypothetical protein